jgi:hypothetical protein
MKIHLMFRENTAGERPKFCSLSDNLKADLELYCILEHMANGDKTVFDACEDALMRPMQTLEDISYRQQALSDALRNRDTVYRLYEIAAGTNRFPRYHPTASDMTGSFEGAVALIGAYTALLKELRGVAEKQLAAFHSEAFLGLFNMFLRELSDSFFARVQSQLEEIGDINNLLISAKLGSDLKFAAYTLRYKDKGLRLKWHMAPSYAVDVEKNPAGLHDLHRRRERAIIDATNVLAQTARFLEGFFADLRGQLAFYVGCLNLTHKLTGLEMPFCIPELLPADSSDRFWLGLYDMSLLFTKGSAVVGNDLEAAGKRLYIITGANQGGKSTFLRSIGQAQLMAQCGMPVGAVGFKAPIRRSVFTHFIKEEDRSVESGKLDEELVRMRQIADFLERGSMVLFNESFSSTNEREGSEICRQITKALVESGMEIFSVTHLYTFAASFLGDGQTQFLKAQRREDSRRTFKILPGEPAETAFGEDLYRQIFLQRRV